MFLEIFVMPFVSALTSMTSLVIDSKNPKLKWAMLFWIVLTCYLGIYLGIQKEQQTQNKEQQANLELKKSQEQQKELIAIVSSVRIESKTNFDRLFLSFGYPPDKVANLTKKNIEQSLQANSELITAPQTPEKREAVTVKYFPKDVDGTIVEAALRKLGFKFERGQPQVKNVPTNSIWLGEQVNIEDVKLVAYTLIRAGVQIKAIRPFRNPSGQKASLIEVGADADIVSRPPLTIDQIRTSSQFTR